jgi:hypothetical protein
MAHAMGLETASSRSRLSAALVLCCWLLGSNAARLIAAEPALTQPYQVQSPLAGQGIPPEDRTAVVVDVSLDQILSADIKRNSFKAAYFIQLSWYDSRAAPKIKNGTDTSSCSLPCEGTDSTLAGCCDDVWLPHVDFPNILKVAEVQPLGFNVLASPDSPRVMWITRVIGTWFSPYDFQAFPFDTQHLLLELELSPTLSSTTYLESGSTNRLSRTPHTTGTYSLYRTKQILQLLDTLNMSDCKGYTSNNTAVCLPADPAVPLKLQCMNE